MSDIAIKVENLSKCYRIGMKEKVYDTFYGAFSAWMKAPLLNFKKLKRLSSFNDDESMEDVIWALKDISFEVRHGEVIGIIGKNGAGKSTLLKIISRITEPTSGKIICNGNVSSLLEVGTGFHPELTGRENVYLNGSILGMTKKEIDSRFDEIVAFSEIEKFLDTPVKRYSSGMRVRLAFSVAAHLEPDIMLIDEVLAVGDVSFQKKCLGKMENVASAGRAVIFVSHNMGAIQNLCSRCLLVHNGKLEMDSKTDHTIREYLSRIEYSVENAFLDNPDRVGNGQVQFTGAEIINEKGEFSKNIIAGESASFLFRYKNKAHINRANVLFTIYNHLGIAVTHINMKTTNYELKELGKEGKLICKIEHIPFPEGQYRVAIAIHVDNEPADHIPNALVFDIVGSIFYPTGRMPDIKYSACMVKHEWEHEAL